MSSLRFPLRLALAAFLVALSSAAAVAQTPETKIVEPTPGSPEEVIQIALAAALNPDEAAGWEVYLGLMHPSAKLTETAVIGLRKFSWNRFRKQAKDYLVAEKGKDGRPVFVVTRQDATEGETHIRIFLKPIANKKRQLPTPIRLQRDADAKNAWRITQNSL